MKALTFRVLTNNAGEIFGMFHSLALTVYTKLRCLTAHYFLCVCVNEREEEPNGAKGLRL